LAIDLANTVMTVPSGETVDLLAGPADLAGWLEAERPRLGDHDAGDRLARDLRALRMAVRGVLDARARGATPPRADIELVNAASLASPVASQLAADMTLVEKPAAPGARVELLGAIARSAIALVTGPDRDVLHVCRAPSCGMFFVGARRWCCAACGNRARVARHYRRTKEREAA
jgi:predicted RNA-binding Zn ribbon-like protein